MAGLRVLLTNNTLCGRAGTELYVRDIAIGLMERGHQPIAYSSKLGDVAEELRAATIPVIDDLKRLRDAPDIIHGQHHLDAMTALLHFPRVPSIFICHGWIPWEEIPPTFPRILKYIAVDYPCRDRLVIEHGIDENRVRVLLNFVDLNRFQERAPLPDRPKRALVFSNQASEQTNVAAILEACEHHGISVDIIGMGANNVSRRPEEVLGRYDVVFAKARSALEALAVGASVILWDAGKSGPMVTTQNFGNLRTLNFGIRTLRNNATAAALSREIARFDSTDAEKVSKRIRAEAGREQALDKLISIYHEVLAEYQGTQVDDARSELQAASAYLRMLAPRLKDHDEVALHLSEALTKQNVALAARDADLAMRDTALAAKDADLAAKDTALAAKATALAAKDAALAAKDADLNAANRNLARISNSLAWRLVNRYGPIKYRFVLPLYERAANLLSSKRQSNVHHTNDDNSNATQHAREVFSDIYRHRAWGDCESVSGPGSGIIRTSAFRDQIPRLLDEFDVRTVLDAGCGDFNWLKEVRLDLESYIGVDVVEELVSELRSRYANERRRFLNLDIISDKVSQVDLILCRDCLVHLSFSQIFAALRNFKGSNSRYLLTTTFTRFADNADIAMGEWRPINLQEPPFNFPAPLRLIDEKLVESGEDYSDKHLGLWELKDINL
ncbi:MAG TPA: glycosyltransferase [Blastocatellia bacterium]|nr:glycosyltransferase [Blastocatellia bacterium]